MTVKSDNWIVGQKLKDLSISREGTLILSVNRIVDGKEKVIIPSGEMVEDV